MKTKKQSFRLKPKILLRVLFFCFFGFAVVLGLALSSTYYYHRSGVFFQHRVLFFARDGPKILRFQH